MHIVRIPAGFVLLTAFVVGCSDQPLPTGSNEAGPAPEFAAPTFNAKSGANASDLAAAMSAMLDDVNVALVAQGADYRAVMVEYVTGDGDEAGATVISKDVGNKQLSFDFVPFDARRAGWSGPTGGPDDDITYAVDMTDDAVPPIGGLTGAQTTAAIDAAMATWEARTCSNLPITQNPDFGIDIGFFAFLVLGSGSPFILADIQHAGWRDIDFEAGILAATVTFGFTGGTCAGPFTDIDANGKCDTAFREIYYDPSFSWANDGGTNFDVEAVALHEAGHGLSQAHFGNIFFKNDGSVKRAPAAVMNPFILGQTRTLLGTDNGGHCSIWEEWPAE